MWNNFQAKVFVLFRAVFFFPILPEMTVLANLLKQHTSFD